MASDLTPARLCCEYLVDPLGVDVARPRLSWVLRSDRRARRQSAYQVLVAGDAERLRAGQGGLWDSGRVESGRSVHVTYDGAELRSGQRCWWAVRVWDQDGVVSPYSEPAWWEMGLLRPEDWRARWIGLADTARVPDDDPTIAELPGLAPSPYLRATIVVGRPIRRARLYATARGVYELRLNGRRVGDQALAPGWTDYDKRIQYQTYDVGALLHEGDNALGAIVGAGWYSGYVGFGRRYAHYGAHPQILAQLHVEYDDGTTETIASDSSWRGTTGPLLFSDLLMGETYDACRELAGWDRPGYDAAGWAPVVVAERDTTSLAAGRAQPVRVLEELAPASIEGSQADARIVDLGQNIVGWVRLRARGAAGTRVRLRFAEILNPDGTIYTENLRGARATDTYILKGEGDEVYEPRFTFHGFRYVEVTGYPGALEPGDITGLVMGSDTPLVGTFKCSNAMVNRLQRNIVWGQRDNFLSIPTDCPQRDERLGWMGDAQIFARTATCNADVAAFFTKWLADVADAQAPSGAFPDVAPLIKVTSETTNVDLSHGAPAWGDAGVIVPWTLYQAYGDTRIIAEHYDEMMRWLAYLGEANPDHRWVNRRGKDYGDWLALDSDEPSELFVCGTPKDLLATAYYAYDARLLARMARALGRDEDAGRYDALFRAIKAAFIAAYVSGDGRIAGDTQTGYALALHMDLLPDELRAAAAQRLVERIGDKDWRLSTGFVGVGYLCPVLTETGHADVAYRLLLNDTFPSWGYSIRHGATTIWERWDGWTAEHGFQNPRMNSFNHYSLGSVGEWLYRYVAGIDVDPDYPGYERIVIRPHVGGGLAHARAEYDSIRGRISSAWQVEDGALSLQVTIPANTTATVYLPVADAATVTEGGKPLAEAEGVELLRGEDGRAVLAVGSGAYDFRGAAGRPTSAHHVL